MCANICLPSIPFIITYRSYSEEKLLQNYLEIHQIMLSNLALIILTTVIALIGLIIAQTPPFYQTISPARGQWQCPQYTAPLNETPCDPNAENRESTCPKHFKCRPTTLLSQMGRPGMTNEDTEVRYFCCDSTRMVIRECRLLGLRIKESPAFKIFIRAHRIGAIA